MLTKTPRDILHVDDDPQMTRFVSTALEKKGYKVHSLNDPQLAEEELLRTECRLALLDIDMPGLDGLELLKRIKTFDGGIQVIMLTGLVSTATTLKAFRWGAEACIFKPLEKLEPLVEVIEESFRKSDRWWDTLRQLSHLRRSEGHDRGVTSIGFAMEGDPADSPISRLFNQ